MPAQATLIERQRVGPKYAPAPSHLVWWLLVAAFIIGIVALLGMLEPGTVRAGVVSSLRPHVTVPNGARRVPGTFLGNPCLRNQQQR